MASFNKCEKLMLSKIGKTVPLATFAMVIGSWYPAIFVIFFSAQK